MKQTAQTAARAEARIRQLCCLGFGSEAVMPALLRELHDLVPSYGNSFYWVGGNGELANVYNEVPESVRIAPLYVDEFYNRRELDVHPGFSVAARTHHGVVRHDEFFSVDRRRLHRSDFYNLIMRPQGYHSVLQLYVHRGGRTAGILQLQRSFKDRDFSQRDERRLARLEPIVALALARHATLDGESMMDSGESGLIIADRSGRVVICSPQARRLLFLATHPLLKPGSASSPDSALPSALSAMCERLARASEGDCAVQSPVLQHGNVWGQFTFCAYRLEEDGAQAGCIGMTVVRQEPLRLRLLRGTRDLPLSRRQAEVAVLMAAGFSHARIARRLGVTRNTVISHSRWIYSKLDVHDAQTLRRLLLQSPAKHAI